MIRYKYCSEEQPHDKKLGTIMGPRKKDLHPVARANLSGTVVGRSVPPPPSPSRGLERVTDRSNERLTLAPLRILRNHTRSWTHRVDCWGLQ